MQPSCWYIFVSAIYPILYKLVNHHLAARELNTSRQRQNGGHIRYCKRYIFQAHFLKWNYYLLIQISLKFVPNGSVDNKPSLVLMMNRRQAIISANDGLVRCRIHASLSRDGLTHWGRVTHICVSKLTTIGSDNGLSPDRRQAIIWTNTVILLIGPSQSKFIYFNSRKCIWKCRQEIGSHLVSASIC